MRDRSLNHPKISFEWNSEPVEVLGGNAITGIRLRETETGDECTLASEGLFTAIGHDLGSELLAGQIDLGTAGYVLVDSRSTRIN